MQPMPPPPTDFSSYLFYICDMSIWHVKESYRMTREEDEHGNLIGMVGLVGAPLTPFVVAAYGLYEWRYGRKSTDELIKELDDLQSR